MRVRMIQQVSGSRDGRPWPAPGQEIDVPDDEARVLIANGTAAEAKSDADTVLVPATAVHVPGSTAMQDDRPFVEAPADAGADPEGARRAYDTAQAGDADETLPVGHAVQAASGAALPPKDAKAAVKESQDVQAAQEAAAAPPATKSTKTGNK